MIDEKKLIEDLVDTYCADCSKCHGICRHDELFKIIDRQPKVDNWISVEERLPNNFERVLTCDKEGNIHVIWHHTSFDCPFNIPDNHTNFYPVIAWMPLPAPYNAKRGGKNELD